MFGMAEIITQADIMKYDGAERAVFEEGTIITPAARDWAKDHKVRIEFRNGQMGNTGMSTSAQSGGKADLLEEVIKVSAKEIRKQGLQVQKDLLAGTVINCLEKMGCKVEK